MNENMMTELKDARQKKLRIEALCERIARLRACAEHTGRQLGERCSHDPTRDRLAEYVAELDGLERSLTAEVIALEKRLRSLDAALNELPPHHGQILRLRYCEGLPWAEVAKRTHYCERQCKRVGKTVG
jgi:DNA-directed RNA polymerase specialized sigma24 family protein